MSKKLSPYLILFNGSKTTLSLAFSNKLSAQISPDICEHHKRDNRSRTVKGNGDHRNVIVTRRITEQLQGSKPSF